MTTVIMLMIIVNLCMIEPQWSIDSSTPCPNQLYIVKTTLYIVHYLLSHYPIIPCLLYHYPLSTIPLSPVYHPIIPWQNQLDVQIIKTTLSRVTPGTMPSSAMMSSSGTSFWYMQAWNIMYMSYEIFRHPPPPHHHHQEVDALDVLAKTPTLYLVPELRYPCSCCCPCPPPPHHHHHHHSLASATQWCTWTRCCPRTQRVSICPQRFNIEIMIMIIVIRLLVIVIRTIIFRKTRVTVKWK